MQRLVDGVRRSEDSLACISFHRCSIDFAAPVPHVLVSTDASSSFSCSKLLTSTSGASVSCLRFLMNGAPV